MIAVLLALALFTQVLPMRAYTTADPVDPERLGLATPVGRYMIKPGFGCEGINYGQNVDILAWHGAQALLIQATADLSRACSVEVLQLMSDVSCFTIAGQCDVLAETD